jgi:hypothetical protein
VTEIYETDLNEADQLLIEERLEKWMQTFCPNIRVQHLPTVTDGHGDPRPFPDYKVWDGHLSTAYGEIKSRGGRYTYDWYTSKNRPYMVSTDKLEMMASFRRRGFNAQFVVKTKDDVILFMKEINYDLIKSFLDAPDWMTNKTNNGKWIRQTPQHCKMIPMKYLKKI